MRSTSTSQYLSIYSPNLDGNEPPTGASKCSKRLEKGLALDHSAKRPDPANVRRLAGRRAERIPAASTRNGEPRTRRRRLPQHTPEPPPRTARKTNVSAAPKGLRRDGRRRCRGRRGLRQPELAGEVRRSTRNRTKEAPARGTPLLCGTTGPYAARMPEARGRKKSKGRDNGDEVGKACAQQRWKETEKEVSKKAVGQTTATHLLPLRIQYSR